MPLARKRDLRTLGYLKRRPLLLVSKSEIEVPRDLTLGSTQRLQEVVGASERSSKVLLSYSILLADAHASPRA
jgi:hypothetical protein